jgi:hypothetical protein
MISSIRFLNVLGRFDALARKDFPVFRGIQQRLVDVRRFQWEERISNRTNMDADSFCTT